MTQKQCRYEAEIITMMQKLKNIEKILMGNGTEGLMRKMEDASDTIIKIRSYDHIKSWSLGGAVAVLTSVCSFLLAYVWYMKLGG